MVGGDKFYGYICLIVSVIGLLMFAYVYDKKEAIQNEKLTYLFTSHKKLTDKINQLEEDNKRLRLEIMRGIR